MGTETGAAQAVDALVWQGLPLLRSLTAALLEYWRRPEAAQAGQLELAQAAAACCCAFLSCANLECEGGPAAGEGVGAKCCRWVGLEGMGRFHCPCCVLVHDAAPGPGLAMPPGCQRITLFGMLLAGHTSTSPNPPASRSACRAV